MTNRAATSTRVH